MICEFFYFMAPCFKLVQRYQSDLPKNVACKDRCELLNRKVPSYAVIKQLDIISIVDLCNDSTCAFPIDVTYDKGYA